MGPLFIDVEATTLSRQDKELLRDSRVCGVILFARNFTDVEQLLQLTCDIRASAGRPVLIAVDHEGGRVQRFREGFTQIPAMGDLLKDKDPEGLAQTCGWLIASELISVGIDLNLGPVLDIQGGSVIIDERSFSPDPQDVIRLATACMKGMKQAGMVCVGKHFPGHGSVKEDTHTDMATDMRTWDDISNTDLSVFRHFIFDNQLDAVMPAHVIYPAVDLLPAGFSKVWLRKILRQDMDFTGIIISDDLSMTGAAYIENYTERAYAAFDAGCDLLLLCNNRPALLQVLYNLPENAYCPRASRLLRRAHLTRELLLSSIDWYNARTRVEQFVSEHGIHYAPLPEGKVVSSSNL